MNDELFTVKNVAEARKWVIFIGTLIGVIILGVSAWDSLQQQVDQNADTICRITQDMTIRFLALEGDGTTIAHENQRDIIAMKKDIEYTAITVSKIADRVGVVQ